MTAIQLNPKGSFEVNTIGIKTGPLHKKLVTLFNQRHDALARRDVHEMTQLDGIIPQVLAEFDQTESENCENPHWLRCKMRAGWEVAKGDYEAALVWEQEGFDHASAEPDESAAARRLSISSSNIADELTRLGRPEEALEWARLSIELWPTNAINHLVMAMALYRAGFPESSNHMVEELLATANFDDEGDVLATCMSYEQELHDMSDLPAVQRILSAMESSAIA